MGGYNGMNKDWRMEWKLKYKIKYYIKSAISNDFLVNIYYFYVSYIILSSLHVLSYLVFSATL